MSENQNYTSLNTSVLNSSDQTNTMVFTSPIYPYLTTNHLVQPKKFLHIPIIGLIIKEILLIPIMFYAGFYIFYSILLLGLNSFVILFTGKYWDYAFKMNLGLFRLFGKISAYLFGVTDTYPGFDTQIIANSELKQLSIDYPVKSSKLLNFPLFGLLIRELLLIPFIIFQSIVAQAALLALVIADIIILFTGKYPICLFQFQSNYLRINFSTQMYIFGMSDVYPSFKFFMKNKVVQYLLFGLVIFQFVILNVFTPLLKNNVRNTSIGTISKYSSPIKNIYNSPTPKIGVLNAGDINNHPNIIRYSIDSDGDEIPDFLETLRGMDPKTSVVDECKKDSCTDPETNSTSKKTTNILLIFDASGSMVQSTGSTTKIQAAKDAINSFVDSLTTKDFNISLMVYGHKGSNSNADKAYSCSQIDVVYPLGPLDKTKFKSAVNSFSATGWTPIEGAFNLAPSVFAGKENDNNHIILISDGIEQCDGNPATGALKLKNSSFKLTVNIIGFRIATSDQQQLRTIAESTGGTYANAANTNDILKELQNRTNNVWSLNRYFTCRVWSNSNYQICVQKKYQSATNWLALTRNLQTIKQDDVSKAENKIVLNLYKQLSATSKRLYDEAGKVLQQQYKEDINKIQQEVGIASPSATISQ